ncbi:MAG: YifB family Mg chelatase-like AAA ATPase [Steroidobacteraceae bacterium]
MSVARIACRGQMGLRSPPVQIEVYLGNGLPCFHIVGLLATEVKESRERVRAAISTAGFELPAGRITVNLAPADLPKDGGRFDLAIALGILAASSQLRPTRSLEHIECFAELGLSGELRAVRGALPAAAAAQSAGHTVIIAHDNASELRHLVGAEVFVAGTLQEVCDYLEGRHDLSSAQSKMPSRIEPATRDQQVSLADVRGQQIGKRALEVAAAGEHSLLMMGPPGCGKSMLAARLSSLLPPLLPEEELEVAMIASITGGHLRADSCGRLCRPFRSPHHGASASAIIGGGAAARAGEITLAHRGVLFLDELPEFDRRVLEALREPLETGRISVVRAEANAEYPARFQLVAAMNPCPCGQRGSRLAVCRCSEGQVERYAAKVSGPLLDRIDLRIALETVSDADLEDDTRAQRETDEMTIRSRIDCARRQQRERQGCSNSRLEGRQLLEHAEPDAAGRRLLAAMRSKLGLSMRGYDRTLRVARTLADLDQKKCPGEEHLAEAFQLRRSFEA